MRFKRTGLWLHHDFLKLWAGQSVSVFGSLIGLTALPFTAILVLDAGAIEVGLLTAMRIAPGLVFGLAAGVWVDRLPRRLIMIVADLGRAAILCTIPVAYAFDALTMGQMYVVAAGVGTLTIFFDVAYVSYLPSLVGKGELVEGNSKLAATASVAEVGGFSSAGWLVQLLSGPLTILIDSVSFVVSAVFVSSIRKSEVPSKPSAEREGMLTEIREGGRALLSDPILRALAGANVAMDFGVGTIGSIYMLYALRLGFEPGVLGVVFAVGGGTSLIGALFAGRAAERFGIGPALVFSLLTLGCFMWMTPAATDASVVSLGLLIGHQFGDSVWAMYEINHLSLRQSITPEHVMGRVNAGMRFSSTAALLTGSLAGGLLGEVIGLRLTLVVGGSGIFAAAFLLMLSPVWTTKRPPIVETVAGEVAAS